MKKSISVVLSVIILISAVCLCSFAITTATVSGDDVSAMMGQQIKVPINISGNPGIMGFKLSVDYDKDYLKPVSVERGNILKTGLFDDSVETSEENRFDIVWTGSENITSDGTLAYLYFETKKAVSSTKIKLSYSQDDTFNADWEDVRLNCNSITVSIEGSSSVSAKGYISDKGISGEKAKAVLEVSNSNSSGYEFIVNMDKSVAVIESIYCLDADVKLYSIEDGSKIVVSNIDDEMNSFSIDLEVSISKSFVGNENYEIICNDERCGYFNITAKAAGSSVIVFAENIGGKVNETVQVPVFVKNCKDLMGYRLNFTYDNRIIEAVGLTNECSIGGNFGENIGIKSGEFSAVWNNSSSITEDGQILLLTVKILKAESTYINISYTEDDTFDESWNEVQLICNPIAVNFGYINAEQEHHHNFGKWTVDTEATCTQSGSELRTCTTCGETETREIKALGHDITNHSEKAATCTESGWQAYETCSRCDYTTYKEIEALGHSFNSGVVTAPTATEQGFTTYTCSKCGYSYMDNFTEPTGEIDENAPRIIVSTAKATAGKRVDVNVIVENNPGIVNMILDITYDSSVLTLVNVTDTGVFSGAMHTLNYKSNPYRLTWANDTITKNLTSNGSIVTLTFEVSEEAEDGLYEVSASYDNSKYDIVNVDFETVDFYTVAGNVEVVSYKIGDINGDGNINTADRMILARYIATWDGYEDQIIDMRAADINCDGNINTADRMILARYIANWEGYATYFE